jgi:hypothetical protein
MDFQSIALPTELPHHFTAKALCEDGLSAKAGGKNKETKSIKEEKKGKSCKKRFMSGHSPQATKKRGKEPKPLSSFTLLSS